VDLDEVMRAVAVDKRSGIPAIAAVAYLRARPGPVAAEHRQVILDGIAQARVTEPLRSLLAALPAEARCDVLHAVPTGRESIRVLDLCLDAVVVPRLVGFAASPRGAGQRDEVIASLARSGTEETIAALEGVKFPNANEAVQRAAEAVVAEAIAAIRVGRAAPSARSKTWALL
jgi:hypothetical protein